MICELTDAAIVTNQLTNEKYRRHVLIKESSPEGEDVRAPEKENEL